jgi:NAD(P)-dependent dehydrogenase (short-subunit alcohol dehydrogenase family)
MSILKGKVAVITGGSRGLGLAITGAYASEGAKVVIGSRSEDAVSAAVEQIQQQGSDASGLRIDVGDLSEVQALADHAVDRFDQIDIWVNNAGLAGVYGPTFHVPMRDFLQTTQTNVLGVYYGSYIAMRYFLSQGSGKLINILGRGSRGPTPYQNAYASSKAWIRNFTLALAKEYQGSGIGVFAYNPGLMVTDMLRQIDVIAGYEERVKPFETIIRMWAKPPIAATDKAVWLASQATDGRTGLEIRATGMLGFISGMLREAIMRLLRQPRPDAALSLRTVEPDISDVLLREKRS